ncbi:MAG TPA: tubulin/FtsZ family protein [Dehalococcoidia bacterium]|nr:tubulin/FtsZ family protein [Dehalococcoidia bacterium]
MKLTVIGLGQCGCRIADHFARLNIKAQAQRKATIAPTVIAVNTDQADLTGLRFIKNDYRHRVLLGLRRTMGHGVGKINELGAQVAKEDGDKVLDAIKASPRFYETHAILLIAGAAGGTGSGSLPIMARAVKDRYAGKPVYALLILPFEHEQTTESRSTYNTATCLKSTIDIVDAVFLADNQRYVRKDASLVSNIDRINRMIAEPFYDLMCAGEITTAEYVGSRTVDGGDIIASLEGWTAVGLGRTELPSSRFPWERRKKTFREKALESLRGTQALDATISDLSLTCDAKDAGKAIYIVSGPEKELNMDMVKSISDYIKELAPNALIRGGDFPGEKRFVDVTLILSQLSFVPRIKDFYEQATQYAKEHEGQLKQTKKKIQSLAELGKDLPTLE